MAVEFNGSELDKPVTLRDPSTKRQAIWVQGLLFWSERMDLAPLPNILLDPPKETQI